MIVDNIFLFIANSIVGAVTGIAAVISKGGPLAESELAGLQLSAMLYGLLVSFIYYVLMELTTGRTFGKMVMGTKVISKDGNTPTFRQVLGRSACRFIPFEPFSFFGNKGFPIGWHDRIPGTLVVKTR